MYTPHTSTAASLVADNERGTGDDDYTPLFSNAFNNVTLGVACSSRALSRTLSSWVSEAWGVVCHVSCVVCHVLCVVCDASLTQPLPLQKPLLSSCSSIPTSLAGTCQHDVHTHATCTLSHAFFMFFEVMNETWKNGDIGAPPPSICTTSNP